MAVDTSIYNALAPRVKSVAEFDAEAQDAQMRKQNMLMNALGIQQRQQEMAQAQRQAADAEALRGQRGEMASWLGAADTKAPDFLNQAFARFPLAAGPVLKEYTGVQENIAKTDKERNQGSSAAAEALNKRLTAMQFYASRIASNPTPEHAWQQLQAFEADAGMPMPQEREVLARMTTPEQIRTWALGHAMKAEELMRQTREAGDSAQRARNDLIGPDGKPNQVLIGVKQGIAKAGASNVNINTGQKGLDNELKLRGDFKQEPIYKAHQEMQAAYSQIQQSLKQATPAGDLAGATKIMKLLDPGSVVRESELGMAMSATGLLDRAQNYAQNIISGNKLTPKQRVEFQSLADALMGESVKQFNGKRAEYERLGGEYGLNMPRALGPEAAQVKRDAGPSGALTSEEQKELARLREWASKRGG